MNEIIAYIGNNRRRVSVGYLLDGKVKRFARKIDGQDHAAIESAINDVFAMGVSEAIVEVYRPNGSAEVICKKFTLPNTGSVHVKSMLGSTPTLFADQEPITKTTPAPQPIQRSTNPQSKPSSMEWKDYALKTQEDKVAKLEAEVKRLTIENRTYDSKIRDFEKEMIKKDYELEKMQGQMQNKSGLSGFMDKAAENPQMMNTLAGLASRLLGLPAEQPMALNAAPTDPNANPETEQYVSNIRAWLMKQPMELQEQFYTMVAELTRAKADEPTIVSQRIVSIINLIKNGTVLKRTA